MLKVRIYTLLIPCLNSYVHVLILLMMLWNHGFSIILTVLESNMVFALLLMLRLHRGTCGEKYIY